MSYYYEFFGLAALAIGLYGSAFYIRSILKGQTKPHVFTHVVWGTVTFIAFLAQLHDSAGPGSWAMGISALACFTNAALALKYGEKNITRGDKIAFIASLTAIIPWVLTKDPLGSVILISIIDAVAFYPTFRKSWNKPWEENLTAYNIANLKFLLSLVAMRNFTIVTTLYVATVMALNGAFVIMCLIRRQTLPKNNEPYK